MKKIYLTLSLGVLILGANAQQKTRISSEKQSARVVSHLALNPTTPANAVATSTVIQITTQTSASLTLSGLASSTACPGGGYVEGTNCYGDLEKANFFAPSTYSSVTSSSITSVSFGFYKNGNEGVSGSVHTVTCSIYNGTYASGPTGAALATATASLSQIIAAHTSTTSPVFLYTFTLTSVVATPAAGFFAAITVPNVAGDTIVVLNQQGATTNFGWEKQSDNTWYDMSGASAWGSTYKASLSMYPTLMGTVNTATTSTGISSNTKGDLTLLAAFPNPATNEVNINFGLNQSAKAEINVFDVTGKLVLTSKLEELEAGNHTTKLDVSNLNAGVYMYSVKSNNAQLFSKFAVVK